MIDAYRAIIIIIIIIIIILCVAFLARDFKILGRHPLSNRAVGAHYAVIAAAAQQQVALATGTEAGGFLPRPLVHEDSFYQDKKLDTFSAAAPVPRIEMPACLVSRRYQDLWVC